MYSIFGAVPTAAPTGPEQNSVRLAVRNVYVLYLSIAILMYQKWIIAHALPKMKKKAMYMLCYTYLVMLAPQ